MRRPLLLAALGTAAAGLLVLLASGRTWGSAATRAPAGARQHVSVTGHAVAPALPALAVALLALAVALLAARGVLRRLVALLVVVAGAAVVPVALGARASVGTALADRVFGTTARSLGGSRPAWWLLAVVGGVVAVVAGAAVVLRGGRWSGLGARYDAPESTQTQAAPDPWAALDRGEDPTVDA